MGPNGKFGPIPDVELAKDPIQVFLDGAFGQPEFKGDVFIRFRHGDEANDLRFPRGDAPTRLAPAARAGASALRA
jgi:hypothetical protein